MVHINKNVKEKKWVDQIDQPFTNRKARRFHPRRHPKRGTTKSSKPKR